MTHFRWSASLSKTPTSWLRTPAASWFGAVGGCFSKGSYIISPPIVATAYPIAPSVTLTSSRSYSYACATPRRRYSLKAASGMERQNTEKVFVFRSNTSWHSSRKKYSGRQIVQRTIHATAGNSTEKQFAPWIEQREDIRDILLPGRTLSTPTPTAPPRGVEAKERSLITTVHSPVDKINSIPS